MPFLIPLVVAAVEAVGAAVAAVGSAIATGVGAVVETVGAVATGIADTVAAAAAPIMESVGAATETVTSAFASGMAPEAVIEATIPGGMSTVGEVTGAIATEGAVGGGMTAADVAAATAAEFGGSTGGLGTMGSTAAGAGGMTAADVAAATAAEFGGSTGGLGTMGAAGSNAASGILSNIGTGALKGMATNAISSAITGRPITAQGMLTSAFLGGAGSGISSGLNVLNPGSPIINSALTGAIVGGTGSALTGGNVGVGILTGGSVGAVSSMLSNVVKTGNTAVDKAIVGAITSGAKTAATGGDAGSAALMGAGSSLISSGLNAIGSAAKNAVTGETKTTADTGTASDGMVKVSDTGATTAEKSAPSGDLDTFLKQAGIASTGTSDSPPGSFIDTASGREYVAANGQTYKLDDIINGYKNYYTGLSGVDQEAFKAAFGGGSQIWDQIEADPNKASPSPLSTNISGAISPDMVANQPSGLSEVKYTNDQLSSFKEQLTNAKTDDEYNAAMQYAVDNSIFTPNSDGSYTDPDGNILSNVNGTWYESAAPTGGLSTDSSGSVTLTGENGQEIPTETSIWDKLSNIGSIFSSGVGSTTSDKYSLFGPGSTGYNDAFTIWSSGTPEEQKISIDLANFKLNDPTATEAEKQEAQAVLNLAEQSKTASAQGSAGASGDSGALTAMQLANQKAYENAVASGDQNLIDEVRAGNTKVIEALAKDIPDIKTATELYQATPWGEGAPSQATPWGEGAPSEAAPWGEWMAAAPMAPLSVASLAPSSTFSAASGLDTTTGAGTGTSGAGTNTGTGTGTTGTGTGTGTSGTGTGSGSSGSGSGSGTGTGITTASTTGTTIPTSILSPLDFTGHVSHGQQIKLQGLPDFEEETTKMEAKTGGLVANFAAGGTTGSDISDYEAWLTSATGKGSSQPRTTRGQNIQLIGTPTFTPQVYAEGGGVQHYSPHFNRGHKERLAAMLTGLPMAKMVDLGFPQFAQGGDVEGHNPGFYSTGGLNSLENTYVNGSGDGTSDSVAAMLADGEFVIPADIVSGLGNGSNKAGAEVLDEFMRVIREHKQKHDPKKLPPNSKGPKAYLLQAEKNLGKKK